MLQKIGGGNKGKKKQIVWNQADFRIVGRKKKATICKLLYSELCYS